VEEGLGDAARIDKELEISSAERTSETTGLLPEVGANIGRKMAWSRWRDRGRQEGKQRE